MMRSILILLLVVHLTVAVYLLNFKAKMRPIVRLMENACVKKTNISLPILDRARSGYLDEPVIMEYLRCVWMESTLMEEDGEINTYLLMDLYLDSLRKKISDLIDACYYKHPEKIPVDDRILDMTKCFFNSDPRIVLI